MVSLRQTTAARLRAAARARSLPLLAAGLGAALLACSGGGSGGPALPAPGRPDTSPPASDAELAPADRPHPGDGPTDGPPPVADGTEPPPPPDPARANLVAFTRGLVLQQIIDNITVQPGSELWTVDPDRAGSERRILAAEGGAHLMPSWSPDKSRLVFASTRGAPRGAGWLNLWTVNVDGSDPQRLTDTDAHDWTPAWSPDGRWIAFGSTRGKRDKANVWGLDVWIVPAGGGEPRVLYAGEGQDEDPVFSRDGRTVYFNTAQSGDCTYQIWEVPVTGGTAAARPLKEASGAVLCGEDPSASADGRALYLVHQGSFRRYDLQTRRVEEVGYAEEPWIGPDGRRFVYIQDLKYIHVGQVGGGEDRRLTTAGSDFFPRWIP